MIRSAAPGWPTRSMSTKSEGQDSSKESKTRWRTRLFAMGTDPDSAEPDHVDTFHELLRAISGVLDIRTVFPKVSEIANKMLAHDRLTMSFDDGTGEIVMQAASNAD